jgi:hypothetical protein
MDIYFIILLITWPIIVLTIISGAYIYIKRKDQLDFNELCKFFNILIILKILDTWTTIRFANKYGTIREGNIVARYMMNFMGIEAGMILFFLITMPLLYLINVYVIYNYKKREWIIFKWLLICIFTYVIIANYYL